MMPENLKQLNLNRPLLSVRRGSSTRVVAEIERSNSPSVMPHYKSKLKSGPMSNPGAIPFKWERIPGRLKDDERELQTKAVEQPPPPPKLPPGRVAHNHNEEEPTHKLSKESCGSKWGFDDASISDSCSAYKNAGELENPHSDGENSTYFDAPDTISRSESFFFNSSVSGLDDPVVESSGTLLDPQTRDFMMGRYRFLPAARAVASETPHFGSRKQPVGKEQPRQVNKDVVPVNQTPRYHYTPTSLPQYLQGEIEEEDADEEEEEEEEYDRTENASAKLCGLLPRFCLLYPVPGMRVQAPTPSETPHRVPKKHTNSCSYDKCEKAIRDAIYERKRLTIYRRSDMCVDDLTASLELDELSQAESLERNNIAPYRSISSGHSLMDKEKGFLGIPVKHSGATKLNTRRNGPISFQELLADETAEEEASLTSPSPTAEKTLYIDSTQIAGHRHSNSSSLESKNLTDSKGITPSMDYSIKNIKHLCFADGKTLSQSINDSDCKKKTSLEGVLNEKVKKSPRVQDHEQDILTSADRKLQLICIPGKDDRKTIADRNPLVHLSLPKSPSESWLSRALPHMSSTHPLLKSYLSSKSLALKPSPAEPKWEALVKSSSLQNNNFRLPGLMRISED